MAELKLSGDLEEISETQLDIIKNVLESHGYTDNEVIIERVGKAGDNYVANVKRIIVKDENKPFRMIAKIAPTNPMIRMTGNIPNVFKNEHVMYTKILPKFNQLLKDAGVPENERLRFAKCYSTCLDEMKELILLEDLVDAGYSVLDRFKPLSNEHVKSILKQFALLHSLSYVLKEKEPALFEEFSDELFDMWQIDNPEQVMFFEMYLNLINTNISMVLKKEDHKRIIKEIFGDALKMVKKLLQSDRGTKQIVIQQGDPWTNNLMFKDGDKPIPDSIMIDYQQSKPGNPVYDLLYFTFNCTDYQTRKEHFYDWMDFYHSELDQALSNFGLKANFIYPRDKFDADLKRYGKMGLLVAALLTGILLAKPEDAERMQNAMASNDKENMINSASLATFGADYMERFGKKIEGIIDSYTEFGLVSL